MPIEIDYKIYAEGIIMYRTHNNNNLGRTSHYTTVMQKSSAELDYNKNHYKPTQLRIFALLCTTDLV